MEKPVRFIVDNNDEMELDGTIKLYEDRLILYAKYTQHKALKELIFTFDYTNPLSRIGLVVEFHFKEAQQKKFLQLGNMLTLVPSKSDCCIKSNGRTIELLKCVKNEGTRVDLCCISTYDNTVLFNILNDLIKLEEQKLRNWF